MSSSPETNNPAAPTTTERNAKKDKATRSLTSSTIMTSLVTDPTEVKNNLTAAAERILTKVTSDTIMKMGIDSKRVVGTSNSNSTVMMGRVATTTAVSDLPTPTTKNTRPTLPTRKTQVTKNIPMLKLTATRNPTLLTTKRPGNPTVKMSLTPRLLLNALKKKKSC